MWDPVTCMMTVCLLQEKSNPQSYYRKYIQALPDDFSHFPIFYTEKDANLLNDTSAVFEFTALTERILSDY